MSTPLKTHYEKLLSQDVEIVALELSVLYAFFKRNKKEKGRRKKEKM